jgi:hypothetical protein
LEIFKKAKHLKFQREIFHSKILLFQSVIKTMYIFTQNEIKQKQKPEEENSKENFL